jgi:hypothetical protein
LFFISISFFLFCFCLFSAFFQECDGAWLCLVLFLGLFSWMEGFVGWGVLDEQFFGVGFCG